MRPRQWTKNLIIYFALFFTIDQAWSLSDIGEASRTFALITAAAGHLLPRHHARSIS